MSLYLTTSDLWKEVVSRQVARNKTQLQQKALRGNSSAPGISSTTLQDICQTACCSTTLASCAQRKGYSRQTLNKGKIKKKKNQQTSQKKKKNQPEKMLVCATCHTQTTKTLPTAISRTLCTTKTWLPAAYEVNHHIKKNVIFFSPLKFFLEDAKLNYSVSKPKKQIQ